MRVFSGNNNAHAMLLMYGALSRAPEVEARGMKTKDLRDVAIILSANDSPFTSFKARNLNLNYCKKELLWYLGADPCDDSIEQHATMWKKLKQNDGTYFSNYGQYLFTKRGVDKESQYEYVIKTLAADPGSRRASMVLLKSEHLFANNTDLVCTYALNFHIDGNALNMTAMMRSNDAVFGFTNDAFCFWAIMLLVYAPLKKKYPNLVLGQYTHFSNSMHIYERHYSMVNEIISSPNGQHYSINVPMPTADEAVALVMSHGKEGDGEFSKWLKS